MVKSALPEESHLYHVISFLVVWIDFIARTYIRIKANYDAVLYVAQKPIIYQHYSHRHHHRRNHFCYNTSDSIHVRRASSSTIPIQKPIHGGLPACASERDKKRVFQLYYGVSKVIKSCDVTMERPEPSVAIGAN